MIRKIHRGRGIVLPSVLFFVVVLSLATYYFSERLIDDLEYIAAQQDAVARRTAGDSGVAYVAALTDSKHWDRVDRRDNRQRFHEILVSNQHSDVHFSIVRPVRSRKAELRFGIVDESGKLNLNDLGLEPKEEEFSRQRLLLIPGMTLQAADSILDWLDEDNEPRKYGAERNYYQTQKPPQLPTNGPVDSLAELAHVRGVNEHLLFGEDTNGDGWLDSNEDDGDLSWPPDDADGYLRQGFSSYLTVHSGEATHRWDGEPKINLNSDKLGELFDAVSKAFDEETAIFVVGLRLTGPTNWKEETINSTKALEVRRREQLGPENSDQLQEQAEVTKQNVSRAGIDLSVAPRFRIRSLYDLFGTQVRVARGDIDGLVSSPWSAKRQDILQWLPKLHRQMAVAGSEGIKGRVNVNTAPIEVLRGIRGLTEEHVVAIEAKRKQRQRRPQPEDDTTTTWLLEEGILELDGLRRTGQYLTGRGDVFSITVLAYRLNVGPLTRISAILDATEYPSRIVRRFDQPTLPATFREQLQRLQK